MRRCFIRYGSASEIYARLQAVLHLKLLSNIMCLYPKLVKNPRYKPTKKNNGNIPEITDIRQLYVPIACGQCMECRKQKARAWQIRMNEELKVSKGVFVTFTFSEESLQRLKEICEDKTENGIATKAVRLFLERWRKKYKKSLRHWLITELGHTGTERIHLHGIIFYKDTLNLEDLRKLWRYGFIHTGQWCNGQTINYIIKYVTKIDADHKDFTGKILCSAGIGRNYITKEHKDAHAFREERTREYYQLADGRKLNLPIYYRNHIYTDEERQKLWGQKLDQKVRWVNSIKIPVRNKKEMEHYFRVLKTQQEKNLQLGYGERIEKWDKKNYIFSLQNLEQ